MSRQRLTVDGRTVEVSNLEKLMYPGHNFTKARVIDYYVRISPYLLPHLKDRPVTLKRFPEGVFGEFFYEKDAPAFTPPWVKTFNVPRRGKTGPDIRYILINNLPTLVWLANLANLEIHPFLHRVPKIDQPTCVAFDCDPGEGADVLTCARVALLLRDLLRELKLESFAKVSGSKGLQVYVPLNSKITYDVTRPFARAVAELLASTEPKLIVAAMPKVFRAKKVFIDWSQNDDYKTTVCVYSLRAKIYKPFVSMPVSWDELSAAVKKGDAERLYFQPDVALKRVEKLGDLFSPINTLVQKLPADFTSFLRKQTGVNRSATRRVETDRLEAAHDVPKRSKQGSRRRFVVLAYGNGRSGFEFGLEVQSVLKCWKLSNSPGLKPNDRVGAIHTDDQSLDNLQFEGIVPKEKSRGPRSKLWDIGTYQLIEGSYKNGFLRIYLNGGWLKGEWTLERVNQEEWALKKTR